MWPMVAMCSLGAQWTAETSLPSIGVNVTFATLFICGGAYTTDDFDRWVSPFSDVNVTVVV